MNRFMQEWGRELRVCLPPYINRWFETRKDRLIIAVEQQTATFYRESGDSVEHLGEYKLNQGLDIANSLPGSLHLSAHEIVLRLPKKRVLSKQLEYPEAMAGNILPALALDMDRQTPFHQNQVYFDSILLKRLPEKNKIQVQLVVIPKPKLDYYLERLQSWGLKPAVVDVVDHPPLNLLPLSQQPVVKNTHWIIQGGLLLLLISLSGVALIGPIWHKQQQVTYWQARVTDLKQEAKEISTLRKKLDQAKASALFVIEKKQAAPTILAILHEITQKFPDDTWAQQFEIKDREIRVRGESAKASSLIGVMENSSLLKNTRFLSPVTTNPTTGRERYQIGADMVVRETTAEKAERLEKERKTKGKGGKSSNKPAEHSTTPAHEE